MVESARYDYGNVDLKNDISDAPDKYRGDRKKPSPNLGRLHKINIM